jgi:uncharacterized protein YecT (DUF1311 family)
MPEAADRDALRKAQRVWLAFHEAKADGWRAARCTDRKERAARSPSPVRDRRDCSSAFVI